MRIELNLDQGEPQRDFLDYLNSAIRSRTTSHTSWAGLSDDGFFRSKTTGPFPIDTAHVPLTWQLIKDREGKLLALEVTCEDPGIPEVRWAIAIHELVTSALVAALSDRRKPFFQRSIFFYIGSQLDGEYWLPGFRLAPALPGDTQPYLMNAERVVTIDMNVNAIDSQNAYVLASEAARRHAARLSLLLNVGLYRATTPEFRWVLPHEDSKSAAQSVRYQLSFAHPNLGLKEMSRKGELCPPGQYKGSLADIYRTARLLSLPPQARRILKGIDHAEPLVTDAFDGGARLYQVASVIDNQFPSVGLAYRVAAVDAIARADRSTTSFGEFMRKFTESTKDRDRLLDYMYGPVRSAHFHAGEFPLGEFSLVPFFDPLMDPLAAELTTDHLRCFALTREAIVNWITTVVPEAETPNPGTDMEVSADTSA